jgi:hypothetical protein
MPTPTDRVIRHDKGDKLGSRVCYQSTQTGWRPRDRFGDCTQECSSPCLVGPELELVQHRLPMSRQGHRIPMLPRSQCRHLGPLLRQTQSSSRVRVDAGSIFRQTGRRAHRQNAATGVPLRNQGLADERRHCRPRFASTLDGFHEPRLRHFLRRCALISRSVSRGLEYLHPERTRRVAPEQALHGLRHAFLGRGRPPCSVAHPQSRAESLRARPDPIPGGRGPRLWLGPKSWSQKLSRRRREITQRLPHPAA